MHHTSFMHDWSFAAGLTIVNILLTLYLIKPRRSTARLIFWVLMLIFIFLYPLALAGFSLLGPTSSGLFLGLAFMITIIYSLILFFSVCWVWVIRHSFYR
ncbi:hypothetical protein JYA63_08760 [Fictibacillus nanhaiensis]|uniref:Uncharacterized protein n=1 Tax=Fictibacillus nanhaiensis TaxID=742169 RepID=A0ABS2ZPQ9_9BACL|nr:hypothetical protein [Fictibacillus nanhaiensis]